MLAHLLDIEQELLQEVQVLIEYVNIDKLLAIDFINIDKFESLFTYVSENEIVDFINNKYSGNSNANEDLESENKDKPLPLLSTHQDKIALEDTLHYCEEQYSEKVDSDFFKTLRTLIHNTVLKVQEEKKQLTTPNTPTLPKTTAKHLQTPEQGTSSKLPLTITLFLASLAQAQTPNSLLNQFARPEDFTSLRSSTKQQEPLQTSSNLLDFLAENQSEHSETAANKENNSEITEEESIDSENKENKMTTYIAKIPEFNGENIETSPQEWLDQVTKAGDANRWNAARMLRTIPYFLKGTAGEWFENLAAPFND
ncbi:hypothetical protein G9A89_014646 [Geosiphon pyriformis]|nr:hypothetical protein G9A89_014646 [Geosiphon pyriformis]